MTYHLLVSSHPSNLRQVCLAFSLTPFFVTDQNLFYSSRISNHARLAAFFFWPQEKHNYTLCDRNCLSQDSSLTVTIRINPPHHPYSIILGLPPPPLSNHTFCHIFLMKLFLNSYERLTLMTIEGNLSTLIT